MAIGEICNREVVVVTRAATAAEAARLMRQHHVGDVVVVMEEGGLRTPVGILTDRDIVVDAIAVGLDPANLKVGEIMTPDLATVREEVGVFEAIRYMRDRGVRRLPVVDAGGDLIGILALDDLLELLAEELGALTRLIARERNKEAKLRP